MTPNPWDLNQSSGYGDLDEFSNADYRPQHAIAPGTDTLPDGPHDCEIVAAVLERTKKNDSLACRIDLRITGGGQIQWSQLLNSQIGVNILCADLAALGFDAEKWGPAHGRPLSREIPAAVARLPGLKFRGLKSSYTDKGGVLRHPLRVVCLIKSQPMPPLSIPQVQPVAPPPSPRPATITANNDTYDDSIPF